MTEPNEAQEELSAADIDFLLNTEDGRQMREEALLLIAEQQATTAPIEEQP